MSKAEDEYNILFSWYKPEENPESPNWMKVIYNRVSELEAEKSELIENFKDLLDDSKYLYQYDPNNFRKTEDEYFKSEIEFLQKYEVKE